MANRLSHKIHVSIAPPKRSSNPSKTNPPSLSVFSQISFEELGWGDYILLPTHYEANFCAGSCEFPLNEPSYNTTKHSYIQSLAARLNPDLVPPPCCAPHELRSVDVIYELENENFVAHEWQGMRAESCGCK